MSRRTIFLFALIINGLVGEMVYLHCNQKAKKDDAPSCYLSTESKADFTKGASDLSKVKGFVQRIFTDIDKHHELLVFSFRSKSIDGTVVDDINDALKFELIDVDSFADTKGQKTQALSLCQEVHEIAQKFEVEEGNFWTSFDAIQGLVTLPRALEGADVFPNVVVCSIDKPMFMTREQLEVPCGNRPVNTISFDASRKGESPRHLVVGYVESCFVKKLEQLGPKVSFKLIADETSPDAPFFIGLSNSKEVKPKEKLQPTTGGPLPPPLSLYSFIEFNYGEKNKDPNTLYAYYSNVDTPVNTDLKKAVVRPKVQLTKESEQPMDYMKMARHKKRIL